MSEYIIINKTDIQKRIKDLKESLEVSETSNDRIRAGIESFEIKQLEWVLSQSRHLTSNIENILDVNGDCLHPHGSVYTNKISELNRCLICGDEWY